MRINELRIAIRSLLKSPGYFLTAMATIALGLGGTTAFFSLVYNQLIRPMPYANAKRLVGISLVLPGTNGRSTTGPFDLAQWREARGVFDKLAIYRPVRREVLVADENLQVPAAEVSSGFFEALGYKPAVGRFFSLTEDSPNSAPMVVISYRFWKKHLNGDAQCVGHILAIQGKPFQIVGIAPENMIFPDGRIEAAPELFSLVRTNGQVAEADRSRYFNMLGVLRDPFTADQAQTRLQGVQQALAQRYPSIYAGSYVTVASLQQLVMSSRRKQLVLLLGAAGILFMLASVNVAGLFLSRGLAKARDAAIRSSLGAGWVNILVPGVMEGLLVSVGGAAGGILFAALLVRVLPLVLVCAVALPGAPEPSLGVVPMLAGCLLAVVLSMVCVLFTTLHLNVKHLGRYLKDGSRGSVGTQGRVRGLILSFEIALTVLMLVASSLLAHSYLKLTNRALGYDTKNVMLFSMNVVDRLSNQDHFAAFQKELNERIASVNGIQSVGMADQGTVFRSQDSTRFRIGRSAPEPADPTVPTLCAGPGYLKTVGIHVIRGRDISWGDSPQSPSVALVNESLVRRYLHGVDPIGQFICTSDMDKPMEIVGVISDARLGGPEVDPEPTILYSLSQYTNGAFFVYLRTSLPVTAILPSLREAIKGLDPMRSKIVIHPFDELLAEQMLNRRNDFFLMGGMAMLAMIIATVGIFGLINQAVAQRELEIALRIALGGSHKRVVLQVLMREILQVSAGILAGLCTVYIAGKFIMIYLVDIVVMDPFAILMSISLISLVTLVACLIPVMQVRRVELNKILE